MKQMNKSETKKSQADLKPKNPVGRPRIQYDCDIAKEITAAAGHGLTQEDIAEHYGMDPKTLRKLYSKELRDGQFLVKRAVAKKLFERCMAGDTACLIFYAKTRLGWREKDRESERKEYAKEGVMVTPGMLTEAEWEKAAANPAKKDD